MPCSNITEILQLHLDSQDRIVFYKLSKETCGGSVGKPSLLRKWIKERPANEILNLQPDDFVASLSLKSQTWEFLHYKHLFAVQKGLRVLLGQDSARPADSCTVESIVYEADCIKLTALINIDAMTDEIRSCTGCGTCGT